MCTVILRVPDAPGARAGEPIRMLAVRDEDPRRPWRPLGEWWPERPGVAGVRDERAGGAWLAVDAAADRVAVLLNRLDHSDRPDSAITTRGAVALDAVAGTMPGSAPAMRGFNLVSLDSAGARIVSWDGIERREASVPPGTHMIAHDDLDDPVTARITRWLPSFAAASTAGERWWEPWLEILRDSAELAGDDPEAIITQRTFEGAASMSLLLCAATVPMRSSGEPGARADVRYAELAEPGHLGDVDFA